MKKIFDDKLIEEINKIEVDLPADDWAMLSAKIPARRPARKLAIWWYAVAASVILLLGFGGLRIYYLDDKISNERLVATHYKTTQSRPIDCRENRNDTKNDKFLQKADKTHLKNEGNTKSINSTKTASSEKRDVEIYTTATEENTAKTPTDTHRSDDTKHKIEAEREVETLEEYAERHGGKKQQEPFISPKEQKNLLKKSRGFERPLYAKAESSMSIFGSRGGLRGERLMAANGNSMLTMAAPIETRKKFYQPITTSLGVGIPLTERLSIHTGIQYTFLHSRFSHYEVGTDLLLWERRESLHYLGVPLGVAYKIFEQGRFSLYASGGAAIDKGLVKRSKTLFFDQNVLDDEESNKIDGVQFSLNGSIGASVDLAKGLNLYIEPRVLWYIPSKNRPQPESKLTETPVMFNINCGLRWNFTKK